jgi:hypothetical protein
VPRGLACRTCTSGTTAGEGRCCFNRAADTTGVFGCFKRPPQQLGCLNRQLVVSIGRLFARLFEACGMRACVLP